MLELRTFVLGAGGSVVAARGDLDGLAAAEIAEAVEACSDRDVVVDLTRACFVDAVALEALVGAIHAVFVVERPLRDELDRLAVRHDVVVADSLAAALAF